MITRVSGSDPVPTIGRSRLWLVKRVPPEQFVIDPSKEVDELGVQTFARVYSGTATNRERRQVFDMLSEICRAKLRLACGCRSDGPLRPEISCREYRPGLSYGMAQMPATGRRPTHDPDCPFYQTRRMRVDRAIREPVSPIEFSGRFALPVGRAIAGAITGEAQNLPSAPKHALPKILRLFCSLISASGLSHLVAEDDDTPDPDISEQFDRMMLAGHSFDVAPGIPLRRVFSRSLHPNERTAFARRVAFRFRKLDADKPRMGFLALYTRRAHDRHLFGPTGDLGLNSDVILLPGADPDEFFDKPSLSLVFYAAPNAVSAIEPQKACVVPIQSGRCFTPVSNDMARRALKVLLFMRKSLRADRPHLSINIEVPLSRVFASAVHEPDFKITGTNSQTGRTRSVYCMLHDKRHSSQEAERARLVDAWRQKPDLSVFDIDEAGLDEWHDLSDAIATGLV